MPASVTVLKSLRTSSFRVPVSPLANLEGVLSDFFGHKTISPEEVVKDHYVGKYAAEFVIYQAEGGNQCVLNRFAPWNGFPQEIVAGQQLSVIIFINLVLFRSKFNLTGVDYIIAAVYQKVNLGAVFGFISQHPGRFICPDSANAKFGFNLINMLKTNLLKSQTVPGVSPG